MNNAWDVQEGGDHYKKMAIQPMQYALANRLDYGQANVIKYVTRFKDKNGKEDLMKAKHCIDLLMAHYYPDTDVPQTLPICQHNWQEVTANDDAHRTFVCSKCPSKKSVPFGEEMAES